MPDLFRTQPDADGASLRLPRWLVDERFDAAMAGASEGGWREGLPDTGLRALAIPLVSISAWAVILLGVAWLW